MKQRRRATEQEADYIVANLGLTFREIARYLGCVESAAFRIKNEVLKERGIDYQKPLVKNEFKGKAKPKFERPPAVYSNQRGSLYPSLNQ